jgi:hypothetical protein
MHQLAQHQAPTLVGEDHSPELMAVSKRINTYTLNTDTLDTISSSQCCLAEWIYL